MKICRVGTSVIFFQLSSALTAIPGAFHQPRRIAVRDRIGRPSVDDGIRLGVKERHLSSSTPHSLV